MDKEAGFIVEPMTDLPLEIEEYAHCAKCIEELPPGEAPVSWARLNVGITRYGLQVWCVRHDIHVAAFKIGVRDRESGTITLNPPADMETCDFCTERPVVAAYPCDDFGLMEMETKSDLIPRNHQMVGAWAACQICYDLIEEPNLGALSARSYTFYISRVRTTKQGGVLTKADERIIAAALKELHLLFDKKRTGPAELLGN